MLTREIEGSTVKCGKYWDEGTYGTLRLRLLETNDTPERERQRQERETSGGFFSTHVPQPKPKLKLKLSEKLAAQAPGMSFLGPYDRELDSDDEDLVFEEQFILRMPPGEDCERLRKMAAAREVSNDVWFKFKGAFFQRAVCQMSFELFGA